MLRVSMTGVAFLLCLQICIALSYPVNGIDLPIYRTAAPTSNPTEKRSGEITAIGLGDVFDITYNVLVDVGNTRTSLVLDTGSSDLWLVSDACTGDCSVTSVPLYSNGGFKSTGIDTELFYGDSRTGTYASGPIGSDVVGLADLPVSAQSFAAINDTNTTVFQTGSAGILGLGFPPISIIWRQLLEAQLAQSASTPLKRSKRFFAPSVSGNLSTGSIGHPPFPSFDFLKPAISARRRRQFGTSSLPSTDAAIASFAAYGPLIARLILQEAFEKPLVATTLQRDTVELGGNAGLLSLGELPDGVQDAQLVWVPVRAYSVDEGGLPPPSAAPDEVYPLVWEIPIDDVYFDGVRLPHSMLSSPAISLSALMDTGNSLIRGPRDVVNHIIASLGASFDCAMAHNLSFQIGGTLFPIDPRDFARPDPDTLSGTSPGPLRCTPALAATDPPGQGGFLYSWSLGDPFLKSALVAYYYGNLTHPSQDPPRIGLMSTVPADAAGQLQQATRAAIAAGGEFPATSDAAPSGTFMGTSTGVGGVPLATSSDAPVVLSTSGARTSGFTLAGSARRWISVAVGAVVCLIFVGLV